jgi:hypothetical protein
MKRLLLVLLLVLGSSMIGCNGESDDKEMDVSDDELCRVENPAS